jgi:putative redox protein
MTNPPTATPPGAVAADAGRWVTARIGPKGFHTDVQAGLHNVVVDEPISLGGTEMGPTPYEYLLTAIGSCTVMTLRMYADRKGWPLEGATVQLRSPQSHQRDCEDCTKKKVGIGVIERRIELSGPITDEQRVRLLQVADLCPVKQTLERGIRLENVA